MDVIEAPSPNFDNRVRVPDMLVLHYTGMQTGQEALDRLRDPEAKVSAHYLIEEDGRIFRLVAEERRAWRRLAAAHHPDRAAALGLTPGQIEAEGARAAAINAAYDRVLRERHDLVGAAEA